MKSSPSPLSSALRAVRLTVGILAVIVGCAAVVLANTQPGTKPAPAPKDDAPSLQAQLDAIAKTGHGTLTLQPWRVYHLSKALLAQNVNGLDIAGNHATLQTIAATPIDGNATGEVLRLVQCSNATVRDVTLDGNRQNRTGTASALLQASLDIQQCNGVTIDGATSINAAQDDATVWGAVSPTGLFSSNVAIRNSSFGGPTGPARNCISVVQGQHVVIRDDHFANVQKGWDGIDVESNPGDTAGTNADITITGNSFDHCYLPVMVNSQASPKNVVIASNRIAFATYGVDCWASGSIIRGNDLHDIASFGIGVFNGGSAVVDGNTVTTCGGCGLYLDGPGQVARSNTFTTCATAAGNKPVMTGANVNGDFDAGGNVTR